MVQQKISIDPELWARTRRKAFDQQTTASKLVEEGLIRYLAQLDLLDEMRELRDGVATAEAPPQEVYVEFRKDGVIKPIASGPGTVRFDGPTGQLAAPPWADPPSVAIAPSANDKGDSFGAAAVIVPDGAGHPKIINDPQVAAAMATQKAQLAGRVIHPVPKPEKKAPRARR